MNRTATIQTRIDRETKAKAQHILADLHITLSEAIGMFLRQVVYQRGIPFDVKIPNEQTAQAIQDVKQGRNLREFSSTDELFEDLDN